MSDANPVCKYICGKECSHTLHKIMFVKNGKCVLFDDQDRFIEKICKEREV